MVKRSTAVVLWVVLLAGTARAEEPSRAEIKYMRSLVSALDQDSPDVRASARGALVAMGPKAAWYFVREITKLKGERLEGARGVLLTLGPVASKAIEEAGKLNSLEEKILGPIRDALSGKIEEGPGDIGLEVDTILSGAPVDRWSSNSPITDRLVALGRDAIPRLLTHLDPARADEPGMQSRFAISALARLCNDGDVPRLGALLDKGWGEVAAVFTEMNSRSCTPFLVRALERGQLTQDIGAACKKIAAVPLREPAVGLVREHGRSFPNGMSPLLEMLVEMQATEALPFVRAMRDELPADAEPGDMTKAMNARHHQKLVGEALAGLGDRAGLPLLIDLLEAEGMDAWMRPWVGKTLTRLTRQYFWCEGSPNEDAHKKYQAWWREWGAKLRWNAAGRFYEVASGDGKK